MPITPLHYPIAYAIYKLDTRLSLSGLLVGAVFPDLEIPIIVFLFDTSFDRLILHSLLGAMTIGTVLSVLVTAWIYPTIIVSVFHRVPKKNIKDRYTLSLTLVFSCLLGSVSHVMIDSLTHRYNPLFWPFQTVFVSPIYQIVKWRYFPFFNRSAHILLGILTLVIVIKHRNNLLNLVVETS